MRITLEYSDTQTSLNVDAPDVELTRPLAECIGMILHFVDRNMREQGASDAKIRDYFDILIAGATAYVVDHRHVEPLGGAN